MQKVDYKYYKRLIETADLHSPTPIEEEISFFGKDAREVLTRQDIKWFFGKPNYRYKTRIPNMGMVEVVLYKTHIGGHSAKLCFHFYHNKLFYYSYTFPNLKEKEKAVIVKQLCEKYLDSNSWCLEQEAIEDPHGSVVYLVDNVDFSIHYMFKKNDGFFLRLHQVMDQKALRLDARKERKMDELYQAI